MFVELWSRIQWSTSQHSSVFKVLRPSFTYLTQGQKQGGQVCFWRHSQKPQGHLVTELGPELTWAHCLPAQRFPPEWLCLSDGLRQKRLQNSAMQSGVRTKPIPQGCTIPSAQRRWEDGMVCPDQQGALETDREREEQQKSWPKEQPFKNDFTLQIQLQRQMDFPARLESKL